MSEYGFTEVGRDDLALLTHFGQPIAAMYGRGTLGPQGFIFTHVAILPNPGLTDGAYALKVANAQNRGEGLPEDDQAYIATTNIDEVQVIQAVVGTLPEALDRVVADPRLFGAQVTYELGELHTIGGSYQEVTFTVAPPGVWTAESRSYAGVDVGRNTHINRYTCAVSPIRVVNTIQPPLGSSTSDRRTPNCWTNLVHPTRASGQEIIMQVVEPHALGQDGIDELVQLLSDLLGFGPRRVTY